MTGVYNLRLFKHMRPPVVAESEIIVSPMTPDHPAVLLSVTEMAAADAQTIAQGTPGIELMEAAGRAVASAALSRFWGRPIVVLCGPGNNGGDGFVAARLLREHGADVRLALLGARDRLPGDAALAADAWRGTVQDLSPELLEDESVCVIDALFGAGLTRPLEGVTAAMVEAARARNCPVLAVDVPSGLEGSTGLTSGPVFQADVTVTFCRRKPGHVLEPGRSLCGDVVVADIGIPDAVVGSVVSASPAPCFVNSADLWWPALPSRGVSDHKYDRGHAAIWGSAGMPGAARLAAAAARRVGAGLVTIAAPPDALPVYLAGEPGALVLPCAENTTFQTFIADKRRTAALVGPGAGVTETTRARALDAVNSAKPTVLDADALTVFQAAPEMLFGAISGPAVLTPHAGEFARLFPDLAARPLDKLTRTRMAAAHSGAVIILKGPDTVIAAPDGRAVININGTPALATAGTGDVLAGMVAGLAAQGMPVFEAAAAAVWLHGAAARRFGTGLIAEDLPRMLPCVLSALNSHLPSLRKGYIFEAPAPPEGGG